MRLTKNDSEFIDFIIQLNKKKIHISEFTNLKDTQIKYKIEKINYLLNLNNHKQIINKYGHYYINNIKDLKNLLSVLEFNTLDKTQRVNIIIKKLLRENYLNFKDLEILFSQSKTSVKADIKNLRKILSENNLKLEKKNKNGFTILGAEDNIRLFFLNFFLKNYTFFQKNFDLKNFDFLVFNLLKGKDSSFETSKIIKALIIIQYYRIKHKNILEKVKQSFFLKIEVQNFPLKIFKRFLKTILKNSNTDSELNFILFFLGGLCYSDNNSIILKKEKQFDKALKSCLINIGNYYNLNIISDKILLKNLKRHLKIALFKLYYNIPITNHSTKEALLNYSHILPIFKKEFKIFYKEFNIKITDEELVYIFFHINSSLIKLEKKSKNSKKVLVVCNLGNGSSEILKLQLEKNFVIKIVSIVSFYQFKIYNTKNIDLIIHTVDNFNSNIPSLKVNPLLSKDDIKNIQNLKFIKI